MVSFFCGKGQGWKEIAHFHVHESGQPRLTCSKYVRHHQTQCFPLLFDFAISIFRCKREGLCRSIWMSVFPRIGLNRMARMTEQKLSNILFATGNLSSTKMLARTNFAKITLKRYSRWIQGASQSPQPAEFQFPNEQNEFALVLHGICRHGAVSYRQPAVVIPLPPSPDSMFHCG